MMKRRIIRVCHKFLIDSDGYDLDIQDLCISLSDQYETYVMFFINKERLDDYIKDNSLTRKEDFYYHKKSRSFILPIFYDDKYHNFINDLYAVKNIRSFKKQFAEYYLRINPDIVHIHGTLAPEFYYAAKLSSCKKFASHHTGLINHYYQHQNGIIMLFKFLIHNLMPFMCKVICVSNYGRESFIFKKNVKVINPVPRKVVLKKKTRGKLSLKNTLHNEFTVRDTDQIYFCPARICMQKNQLHLVKAFDLALENNPGLKLILAGKIADTQYYDKIVHHILKSRYKDNYCITTQISQEEVSAIMQHTSYVILPSINEGLGRSALEAINKGIPVIASNEGGFVDYIKHQKNGYLANPHKIQSIQQAIIDSQKHILTPTPYNHSKYIESVKELYAGE